MVEDSKIPNDNFSIDGENFVVLINAELQHSLWPSGKAIPEGWTCVFPAAPKAECLAYVEAHWTDLRPLSARSPDLSSPVKLDKAAS
jgi:MbtH protein